MTLDQALEAVISRTGHRRYRWLCGDENPDAKSRERYRAQVIKLAGGQVDYPPVATQVASAVKAGVVFVKSGFKVADKAEQDRRRAICRECESFDRDKGRCRKCGCNGTWKAWVASQRCPVGKW